MVTLVRQKNFEHMCRATYRFSLIMGDNGGRQDSDVIEGLFTTSGSGSGKAFEMRSGFRQAMYSLATGRKCVVRVEMLNGVSFSECMLQPLGKESKDKTTVYDRDKQAWQLMSDTSLESLRFRLHYTDIRNLSRRFLRYVGFALQVVPGKGQYKPIRAVGAPFSQLYALKEADQEGFDIKTDISVKEVSHVFYLFCIQLVYMSRSKLVNSSSMTSRNFERSPTLVSVWRLLSTPLTSVKTRLIAGSC